MEMTRVWNITNDPESKVQPQNLNVLGRVLRPGKSIQVTVESLKNAHKTMRDVERQLLAIGKDVPEYLRPKTKATLLDSMARAHGSAPVVAIAEAAPAQVEAVLTETVATEEPTKEEYKSEDDGYRFGKHKKGK
jgi:hypothetical protein